MFSLSFWFESWFGDLPEQLKLVLLGMPGWLSGWAPAFGPWRHPGVLGLGPAWASCMEPASLSAHVSASLSLSLSPSPSLSLALMNEWIKKLVLLFASDCFASGNCWLDYLSSVLLFCSLLCECKTLDSHVCLLFSSVEGKLNNNITTYHHCQFKAF